MDGGTINWEYLNLYQEIPLFVALKLRSLFRRRAHATGRTLIVNACLVGEFATSVPAIRDYIMRHPEAAVDLMVSPSLASFARHVRGVHTVYTARSLYGRRVERERGDEQKLGSYDHIFVMRVSADVYQKLIGVRAGEIRTGLYEYSGYALHLWGSLLGRRRPKQWRELNFEMLGGTPRAFTFEELFEADTEDIARIRALPEFSMTERNVVIHTGVNWSMKHWSTDAWAAFLIKAHTLGNIRFIFVGGTGDEKDYAAIAAKLDFPLYSLIGKTDMWELVLALRQADCFIGVDSGPRNIAHLVDVPSVCILGPGPHFYLPENPRDIVLDRSRGRGLFQMFVRTKSSFIDQILPEEVYAGLNRLLNLC